MAAKKTLTDISKILPKELNDRILERLSPHRTKLLSKTILEMHKQRFKVFCAFIMRLVDFSEKHNTFEYSIHITDIHKQARIVITFKPNEKQSDELDIEYINVEYFRPKHYTDKAQQTRAIQQQCNELYDRISSATKVSVHMAKTHPHLRNDLTDIVNAFKVVMLPHASLSARSKSI